MRCSMKKLFTMICIATMLVMACSLSGCGKAPVKETTAQQINYTERTFTIVDKLVNNKITDFYSYFDENMKKQVSQADVQQVWASLISDYGAFDYYKTDITLTTKDGYQIVDVPVIFKNGSATLRFALNAKGEISGFFITDNATASNSMQLANDTEVTFGSAEYPISGSLTLPEGEGPFPAVILVHGSGPSDRNEQIGPNLPFMDLPKMMQICHRLPPGRGNRPLQWSMVIGTPNWNWISRNQKTGPPKRPGWIYGKNYFSSAYITRLIAFLTARRMFS